MAKAAFLQVVKIGNLNAMRTSVWTLFFWIFFPVFFANGQEIRFTASVSKSTVAVGEPFKLTYTINSNASSFSGPDLSAFDVYSGPNQSSEINMSGGNISQKINYFYTLAAKKTGKITISPAKIRVANGLIQSNPVEINVSKSAQAPNQTGSASQNTQTNQRAENLFIRAELSKSSCYLGEPVVVTYKVYNRYSMVNLSDVKYPSFNGFYSEEITLDKNGKNSQEVLNGLQYTVVELKKTLLIPQKSGKLEIPPLDVTFLVRERSTPQSIFDQLMGGGYRDVEVKGKSQVLNLEVLPLPSTGKPADFTGAVGQYSFKIEHGASQLKSGDAFNLKMNIQGKGNLKLVEKPSLQMPAEIEIYDPQEKENLQVNAGGMSGTKTFDYLLIPRAGGSFTLGPFSFTYFDPLRKSYQTITSAAIKLEVEKSAGDQTYIARSGAQSGTQVIASDIRFNKTQSSPLVPIADRGFLFSPLFYFFATLPPLFLLGLMVYRKRQKFKNENKGIFKVKEAGSLAKKRLHTAKEFEKSGKTEEFYAETLRALYGYLGDKLQIPVSELNRSNLIERLNAHSVSPELENQVVGILNTCEMARYSPGSVSAMSDVYDSAVLVITELEKTLKK